MKFASLMLLLAFTLPQSRVNIPQGGAWCCLCMCGSKEQDKCARYCIVRQQGKKIVEENEMNICTRKCEAKFHKH